MVVYDGPIGDEEGFSKLPKRLVSDTDKARLPTDTISHQDSAPSPYPCPLLW